MPRNPDLPHPTNTIISKATLPSELKDIDKSEEHRNRVLAMETEFRKRMATHVGALPPASSSFNKFNTNPFVLMIYAKQNNYMRVSDIERDILPAKLFSSMETSAGRMIQDVVLPVYGWENVVSSMHSASSVIDGRRLAGETLELVTLKSGPRTLNDEMSKDLADDIVGHAEQWANESEVDHIEFTYGVLYGTKKRSNKKDWHILRNIVETVGTRFVLQQPKNRWDCSFRLRATRVDVAVRIGGDWWNHLGGNLTLTELLISVIRASVAPTRVVKPSPSFTIQDLDQIVSTARVPARFNVSLLQRSQIEWLFFLASHYCDKLTD